MLRRRDPPGRRGESLAAEHLKRSGYRVLARNLRNRFGEIDLLARAPDGTVIVAEVKTAEAGSAMPELRVDAAKQRRLAALAAQAARRHKLTGERLRFDVLAVTLAGDDPTVRHIQGAFESPY